jgi:hypothetical protein
VICVTPSYRELWFNERHEMKRREGESGGRYGDATMSRIFKNSSFYDESLIDHRNERPLAIAFATIILVWMLAFGLVSVSGQLHAQSSHFADGCARAISTMMK